MDNYIEYGKKMLENDRAIVILKDGRVNAMAFFSMCDDPKPYLDNIDCVFIPHDPKGKIVVVENMVCLKFTKALLSSLEQAFVDKFPQVEKAMWRRNAEPEDRILTYNRRIESCALT